MFFPESGFVEISKILFLIFYRLNPLIYVLKKIHFWTVLQYRILSFVYYSNYLFSFGRLMGMEHTTLEHLSFILKPKSDTYKLDIQKDNI